MLGVETTRVSADEDKGEEERPSTAPEAAAPAAPGTLLLTAKAASAYSSQPQEREEASTGMVPEDAAPLRLTPPAVAEQPKPPAPPGLPRSRPDPPGPDGGEGCNKWRDPETGKDWWEYQGSKGSWHISPENTEAGDLKWVEPL